MNTGKIPNALSMRELRLRWKLIPESVYKLSLHDPIVHQCCHGYAYGHIATVEDLLVKIIELQTKRVKEIFERMALNPPPIVISFPKDPRCEQK